METIHLPIKTKKVEDLKVIITKLYLIALCLSPAVYVASIPSPG